MNLEEQNKLDDPNSPKIMDTLFPTFEESSQKLARGFALGAVFALSLLGFRNVRKNVVFETVLVSLVLGVVALTCSSWEHVAQYLTEQGNGEPIAYTRRRQHLAYRSAARFWHHPFRVFHSARDARSP